MILRNLKAPTDRLDRFSSTASLNSSAIHYPFEFMCRLLRGNMTDIQKMCPRLLSDHHGFKWTETRIPLKYFHYWPTSIRSLLLDAMRINRESAKKKWKNENNTSQFGNRPHVHQFNSFVILQLVIKLLFFLINFTRAMIVKAFNIRFSFQIQNQLQYRSAMSCHEREQIYNLMHAVSLLLIGSRGRREGSAASPQLLLAINK